MRAEAASAVVISGLGEAKDVSTMPFASPSASGL
jgi:hypothetical protein